LIRLGKQDVADGDRRAEEHGACVQRRERPAGAHQEADDQQPQRRQQRAFDADPPGQRRGQRRDQAETQHRQRGEDPGGGGGEPLLGLDLGEHRRHADDRGPQVRGDQHDRHADPPRRRRHRPGGPRRGVDAHDRPALRFTIARAASR
jgi:hypothetical protein